MLLVQIVSNNLKETQAKALVKKASNHELGQLYNDLIHCFTQKTFNHGVKFLIKSKQQLAMLRKLHRYVVKCAKKRIFKHEYNQHGTRIIRDYTLLACNEFEAKYLLDENWVSFYAFSHDHKYWLNETEVKIVCYCQGNIITRIAQDNRKLKLEQQTIINWFYEHQ